jgi:hypothetical protein
MKHGYFAFSQRRRGDTRGVIQNSGDGLRGNSNPLESTQYLESV